MIRKYSWIPDIPDFRDYKFTALTTPQSLPLSVDLRKNYDHVYDQGQIGSCTANALSLAFDFTHVKEGKKPILPSRLFLYYDERKIEGNTSTDSGAQGRDGIKTLHGVGVCPETMWLYDEKLLFIAPSHDCYNHAFNHKIKGYERIDNTDINALEGCLADGYTFAFGFTVYSSFESDEVAATGIVPMPLSTESVLGGHYVVCIGYDDEKQWFIVRNSWGPDWGDKGHFYIPYAYLTNLNLADDFWTIRLD